MKKFIVTTCGIIVVGLMLISSATAVPKVNSDPLMSIIADIEKNIKILEETLSDNTVELKQRESMNLMVKRIKDALYSIAPDLRLGGLIDFLIQIIQWLITFIQQLINLVIQLINLGKVIYALIYLIAILGKIILAIIDLIRKIFNPETSKAVS